MIIFRTILGLVRGVLTLVSITLYLFAYSVIFLFSKRTQEKAFELRRNWLKVGSIILGLYPEYEGIENIPEHACLYVSNHRSFSDPFYVANHIDAFMIARSNLSKLPILDYGFRLTGVIYVDRDSQDSRKNTREKLVETIKSGANVFVYPEGTTNEQKTTRPFKPGCFKEAVTHGFDVVPVTIEYQDERAFWRVGSLVKQYFIQYGYPINRVKVKIDPPIRGDDAIALMNKAQSIIDNNMLNMQKDWIKADFKPSQTS